MKDLTGKGKPFHSALDKAAGLLKRKVGTGAEFMQELKGLGGIKQAEIDERKLGEVMGMPRMTHDQFMANLATRPVPKIREKVLSDEDEGGDDPSHLTFEERNYGANNQTHHGKWTLPGGKNYREILIKAPKGVDNQQKIMELEAKLRRAPVTNNEEQDQWNSLYNQIKDLRAQEMASPKEFEGVGAHFGGEPGILASMRVKDRMVPDTEGPHSVKVIGGGGTSTVKHPTREAAENFADVKQQGGYRTEITPMNQKKYLHLEELQSDWHQKGREKGYNKDVTELPEGYTVQQNPKGNDYRVMDSQGNLFSSGMSPETATANAIDNLKRSGVPDAPFKKNWEEMALKRLVHHAAEKGYHGIVVTPGEEQADRYSLAKHVDRLEYHPESGSLVGMKGRDNVVSTSVPKADLASHIGQEAATKLLQQPLQKSKRIGETNMHLLEGEDIKMGGEGMKGFYDKKVPNILNSIGKKYGVKTELNGHQIETEPAKTKAAHYFPITEDMRKDITTNGLPLYAEGGIIRKAEGGNVQPSLAQMKLALGSKGTPPNIKDVGINEAINLAPKVFMAPDRGEGGMPAPGGVATRSGMPIGGIDMSKMNPGQQLMAQPQQPQQPPQGAQPPQGGMAPQGGQQSPQGPTPPMGNMLSMTRQGQALGAMGGAPAQGLAKGGQPSVDSMKAELAAKKTKKAVAPVADEGDDDEEEPPVTAKRITIKADGPGGVTGIVVPHHMLHGRSWISKKTGKKVVVPGMADINKARAEVYGSENRDPLSIGQIGKIHKDTLTEHFSKSPKEQMAAEKQAMQNLRNAKHLGAKNNTLDESEKLDTVRHETDEQGRTHVGFASKGVAGHALYTSGHGDNMKYHVINTCPGQTEGCGGGKDSKGVVDTSKGTCFAPNAESQYVHAAVRRATHEQAKHDPKMTKDWILSHTGSIRDAAKKSDKNNQRLLFRPNVVDETDVSSRHVIRHLNEQRKTEDKPPIIANSYGKTNELHDPENGYHVTHSNVGPKVKKGQEIAENVGRDKARVRNTIMAADNRGDFKNEQGNKTPPKGSYMVTDVKRGSPMANKMEEHITHAKYWTTGRSGSELTENEKEEGPEGHFNGSGRKTSEDKAHYGHTTVEGKRFDYQRQNILHPRLVNVPIRKKNKKTGEMETKDHMIPTDSRFKDTEFLPKNRFKTKNGKEAGHILMTTPTESTSNIGHETSFTHNVSPKHIEHAMKNNGEYEIDKPEDQIKAAGKEYRAPQAIKFYAEGGNVGYRHPAMGEDDFHAFPEQNGMAQRHLAMRRGEDQAQAKYDSKLNKGVKVHKNMDTMRLELARK